MTEFVSISKETYNDFLIYGRKHIEGFHARAQTISDCVNTYNADNETITTRSVFDDYYKGLLGQYKIRADYLEAFNGCPEDERYPKQMSLNHAEYTALLKDLSSTNGKRPMIDKLLEAGIDPLGKMTCKIDYDKGTYTIIEG